MLTWIYNQSVSAVKKLNTFVIRKVLPEKFSNKKLWMISTTFINVNKKLSHKANL